MQNGHFYQVETYINIKNAVVPTQTYFSASGVGVPANKQGSLATGIGVHVHNVRSDSPCDIRFKPTGRPTQEP